MTDTEEFWQLIDYVDDNDIRSKLKKWENFYNCYRPQTALKGKAPFEVLRERLLLAQQTEVPVRSSVKSHT